MKTSMLVLAILALGQSASAAGRAVRPLALGSLGAQAAPRALVGPSALTLSLSPAATPVADPLSGGSSGEAAPVPAGDAAATPIAAAPAIIIPAAATPESELAELHPLAKKLADEYAKAIVGQEELGTVLRLALWGGGHALAEGLHGNAKTRSVKAVSKASGLSSSRIQFTPDMQPFDITGQEEKDHETGLWVVRKGPIFANIVLADEINRTKPNTQSALLQPMAEKQTTIGRNQLKMEDPFVVLATQNPSDSSGGTFPLPEPQYDRFMLRARVPYLGEGQITKMLDLVMDEEDELPVSEVLDKGQVLRIRKLMRSIKVADPVRRYIERLVLATRPLNSSIANVKSLVEFGASDRAAIVLLQAARALAFERGQLAVVPDDVKDVAKWVLAHRIFLTYDGQGKTKTESLVEEVVRTVPAQKK